MKLNLRLKEIVIAIFVMIVCILLVVFTNQVFIHEEGDEHADVQETDVAQDYLQVDVHVLAVDLAHEHLTLELTFTPHGTFDAGDGLLAAPLDVYVSSVTGEHISLEADRRLFPHEMTVDLYEGEVNLYPFDKHKALLELLVMDANSQASIPTQLDFFGFHHGFRFTDVTLPENQAGYVGFDVHVERSAITLGTAIFIMATMWGLTIVNLFLLWAVLTNRMSVDLGLFGYMSGFLVAMYFLRALFPDIPNFLGVFADYLAFFWVEFVTAGISILLAGKWFINLTRQKPSEM